MSYPAGQWLVETDWLEEHLHAPDLVVMDASWHMPADNRDAKAEYLAGHIPGALFFDIDDLSDTSSPFPHMLPAPEKFSSRMRRMGIGDGSRIVVYDTLGLFSAARAWWTFRVMGVRDVAVLNGGLPKWKAENRPIEDGEPRRRTERHFTVRRDLELLRDRDDVQSAIKNKSAQLVDARSPDRFSGSVPEPRQGVRPGHIPGSSNVHYASLLQSDGTLKPADELMRIFAGTGLQFGRPVVASCGSGLTAGILALSLSLLGHSRTAVYDGSWTEWGSDESLPIETGAPVAG